MPTKRQPDRRKPLDAELDAYNEHWLKLADAALSATEKAATALEVARQEQERIRLEIKRTMQRYSENLEEAKKLPMTAKHAELRWNPATLEWYCVRCGRTSDHITVQDAEVELNQFDCTLPQPEDNSTSK